MITVKIGELDDVRLQKLLTVNRPQSLLPHAEPGVLPTLSVAHGSGSSLAAANVWQQIYEQQHERGA